MNIELSSEARKQVDGGGDEARAITAAIAVLELDALPSGAARVVSEDDEEEEEEEEEEDEDDDVDELEVWAVEAEGMKVLFAPIEDDEGEPCRLIIGIKP